MTHIARGSLTLPRCGFRFCYCMKTDLLLFFSFILQLYVIQLDLNSIEFGGFFFVSGYDSANFKLPNSSRCSSILRISVLG